ncbi:response regulator [Candidatus Margulisiibacteriota bacterium]
MKKIIYFDQTLKYFLRGLNVLIIDKDRDHAGFINILKILSLNNIYNLNIISDTNYEAKARRFLIDTYNTNDQPNLILMESSNKTLFKQIKSAQKENPDLKKIPFILFSDKKSSKAPFVYFDKPKTKKGVQYNGYIYNVQNPDGIKTLVKSLSSFIDNYEIESIAEKEKYIENLRSNKQKIQTSIKNFLKKIKVLYAEDDETTRNEVIQELVEIGMKSENILGVEDGSSALNEVNESYQNGLIFDLIITDNDMPIMPGPKAITEIRKKFPIYNNIPTIILSGYIMRNQFYKTIFKNTQFSMALEKGTIREMRPNFKHIFDPENIIRLFPPIKIKEITSRE